MDFVFCTLFPEIFSGFFSCGIIRKAITESRVACRTLDIREFAEGRHRVCDDRPFGGGQGMVMKPEPLSRCLARAKEMLPDAPVVLMSPQGPVFTQEKAHELALGAGQGLILVCGRYEGVDERFIEQYVDLELSIGDFILSGGEPAAMVVADAVIRLIPGVLGNELSADTESFEQGLLEHAQYTRPRDWEGRDVPEVLLSGHHAAIDDWQEETALLRTLARRPDLLKKDPPSGRRRKMLENWDFRIRQILEDED